MRKRDLLEAAIAAPFCLCSAALAERNVVTNRQTSSSGTPVAAFSPNDQDALTTIAKNGMTKERQPGLIVGIRASGRGNWKASFGKADIAANVPICGTEHIRMASITKTFAPTAILQLVDLGELQVDDTLSTFIGGLPYADVVTTRNLLGMTSGTYDFTMDDLFSKD
jgi:D-alanyl-D-alanine carboxypeptidase